MTFEDTDELRAILKTVKTYGHFWRAKEPHFGDMRAKFFFDWRIAAEDDDADEILSTLKSCEVQQFSQEFTARQKDRLN